MLWDTGEPYRPPCSFAPLVGTYVAAFYTAVVAAAFTEQLYKVRRSGSTPQTPLPLPGCAGVARKVLDEMLGGRAVPFLLNYLAPDDVICVF